MTDFEKFEQILDEWFVEDESDSKSLATITKLRRSLGQSS